jgi:hypothetical protein
LDFIGVLDRIRSRKEKVFLVSKTRHPLYLCLLKEKAKDAAPTGAIRKIGLFCCHLKEGSIK